MPLSQPQNILDNQDMLDSFLSMKLSKSGKNKKDNQQLPNTKNFISSGKKPSEAKQKNILNQVMRKIEMLCNTVSMVVALSKGNTYRECLNNIDNEKFIRRFGIDKQYVIKALDNNILPEKLLDACVVTSTSNTIKSGDLNKFQELSTIGIFPELGIVKSNEKELWLRELKKINLKNKKIVSLGTNMGHEVSALLELGVPKENITIIDKSGFPQVWKAAGINVIEKPIEEISDMKFDVAVGNPPFSEGNTGKGGTSIYQTFAEWALKNCKVVSMITPGSFMTGSRFETMRKLLNEKGISNIENISLDTFSGASIVNPVYWVADDGMKKVEDFLSKEIKLLDKIVKKSYNRGMFEIRTGKSNVSTSDTVNLSEVKTSTHKFKYIDRVRKDGPITIYCNKSLTLSISKYLTVFAQRGGMTPKMFLSKNANSYSQNVMAIQVNSEKQHDNLVKLFSTTTYKFMLNVLSGGNSRTRKGMPAAFTSGKLKTLPALDLDKSWTNDKVNKELNLSNADIKFIKNYVG